MDPGSTEREREMKNSREMDGVEDKKRIPQTLAFRSIFFRHLRRLSANVLDY